MLRPLLDRVLALLAICVLLAPTAMPESLRAQDPAVPTSAPTLPPEAAAQAFFAALESGRWPDAARLVHSAALMRYREQNISMVRSALREPERPVVTPEVLLRHDPQMPREVAEYQARRVAEASQDHRRWALEHAGVASLEELERLSPEEAFARFLAANDERRAIQRAVEREADPAMGELLARAAPRTERTVIGSVPAPGKHGAGDVQADSVAYVVYSVTQRAPHTPSMGPERVAVVGARRDGAVWKVDPGEPMGHELFGGGSFAVSVETEGGPSNLLDAARHVAVWPAQGTPRLRARMAGAGADPLKAPPTELVLERLAPDGTVTARVEVPAEAWDRLADVVVLWSLLIVPPEASRH
jgi:hypothetical protein